MGFYINAFQFYVYYEIGIFGIVFGFFLSWVKDFSRLVYTMAYLLKYLKEDLMLVAREMGVEVAESYRKVDIKKKIIASEEYDEEVVKFQLDAMVEDRRVKLEGVPFCFSKFMSQLLQGCEEYSVPYLDDVALFSDTWEDHLKHLDEVLKRVGKAGLTIKPSKCRFAQSCVKYLGHMVGGGCRTPAEAKVHAVLEFPVPRTKTQIRQFLGLSGYYSRYIKGYATIVEPLTRALKGKNRKEKIEWTEECEKAVKDLKQKLTDKPVLYAPDFTKEFIVQTDASDIGIGVVLGQKGVKDLDHPVLYLSRKFTDAERKYCATEKECAGIIYAIKKLRHYLDGQKFIIETDHNPLVFLKNNAGNNHRLMRWALALQPFNYTVVHRAGKDNKHADCLSRMF